ncbi:cytochrome c biogenesis heme-transporting ATPase CcmA [Nitrosovibrio sp. Nv17]|jgi:heme exporter protein A|uniref:cytochrome c biogenesis heme-transporting ATPase CcmA n=1 Tax=Nitrosovibrio sp. Nv17 TaxID=1855339 RepID=UPI0009090544|nr:cytochrome c biogenesis heme-transporting ATPase CcmA [Nitrosovibrio sp. Nv17]SFW36925.1 heme exporter protein A [Nitrosovibrio sp. Nv17]
MPTLKGIDLECMRGDRVLFSGLGFTLEAGGLMQVQGPNGSGKTSLLRMLCGLARPAQGEIRWNGTEIRTLGGEYYGAMTYLGHLGGIKDDLTAVENLRISSLMGGAAVGLREAWDALRRIGLEGRELLPGRVLSQGQRRRVTLARLLVCETILWILDEPLTALDAAAVKLMQGLMESHLARGGMIVMTTHQDIDIAAPAVQRLQLA